MEPGNDKTRKAGNPLELNEMRARIEAVLFAHAEPLSTARLAEILEAEEELVERLLRRLADDCDEPGRGIQLIRLEDAWQLATKSECGEAVKKALDTRRNAPLSAAALEILAIIAYNQPVSRAFIDQVRGVDSSSSVAGLVEKGLIAEAGRLDLPGRPISYRTTDGFLRAFGITSLNELPPLHSDSMPEDESGLYALPDTLAGLEAAAEGPAGAEEETRALRGGAFIETAGGAAGLAGAEDDDT